MPGLLGLGFDLRHRFFDRVIVCRAVGRLVGSGSSGHGPGEFLGSRQIGSHARQPLHSPIPVVHTRRDPLLGFGLEALQRLDRILHLRSRRQFLQRREPGLKRFLVILIFLRCGSGFGQSRAISFDFFAKIDCFFKSLLLGRGEGVG